VLQQTKRAGFVLPGRGVKYILIIGSRILMLVQQSVNFVMMGRGVLQLEQHQSPHAPYVLQVNGVQSFTLTP
jgi:hypothetical protein